MQETSGPFRRAGRGSPVLFLLLLGVALGAALTAPASTQDAGAIARQADAGLRAAERAMFAGQLVVAGRELAAATALLEQAAAADPRLAQLAGLQRRRDRLAADIGRRSGGTPPPPVTGKEPPAGGPALPGPVQKRLRDLDAELGRLRGYLASDSVASPGARVDKARGQLAAAAAHLDEIAERYGREVPADHPELVAARARLEAAERDIAAFAARLAAEAAAAEAAAARPPEPGSPAADRARVEALGAGFGAALEPIHGNSLVLGLKLEDAERARDQLARVDQEVLPVLQPVLAELVQRYGATSMAIDQRLHELGVPPGERFSTELARLIDGVERLAASKAASAASIADNATMMLDGLERIVESARVPRMEEQRQILRVGQQIWPADPRIHALLEGLDERIAAMAVAIERDIDGRTWAGSVADFAGPGEVGALAKAARAWFAADPRWGAHPSRKIEVLAVAVRGPWRVAERDVFGRVVRWRLPIHLAITDAVQRPAGVARVYELSLLAMEGAPDRAAQAPPFDGYWVGESWSMRIRNLPEPRD
jgi:hypothetical protein